MKSFVPCMPHARNLIVVIRYIRVHNTLQSREKVFPVIAQTPQQINKSTVLVQSDPTRCGWVTPWVPQEYRVGDKRDTQRLPAAHVYIQMSRLCWLVWWAWGVLQYLSLGQYIVLIKWYPRMRSTLSVRKIPLQRSTTDAATWRVKLKPKACSRDPLQNPEML